jgi:general secretion pathway protein I
LSLRTADLIRPSGGFTLLEVLVALAVMASMLGAIAALTGSNARASRLIEGRTALAGVAGAVAAGIPPRSGLEPGSLDGEIDGHRWQARIRAMPDVGLRAGSHWLPRQITLRIRAPSGQVTTLETVRLVPAGPQ